MLKDMLSGKYTAGLSHVELHDLPEPDKPQENATLSYSDAIKWTKLPHALRVEFTRNVGFIPEGILTITVSYYVDHELQEENSLKDISADTMKSEICSDLPYYLQESQGFPSRVSQIIANLSSSFGGTPVILPPTLPTEETLH